MAEKKPGFLKRIFSFGKKAEAELPVKDDLIPNSEETVEETTVSEITPEPISDAPEENIAEGVASEDVGDPEDADDLTPQPKPVASPSPDTSPSFNTPSSPDIIREASDDDTAPSPVEEDAEPVIAETEPEEKVGAEEQEALTDRLITSGPDHLITSGNDDISDIVAENAIEETVLDPQPAQEPVQADISVPAEEPKKQSWFQRLKTGLSKSSSALTGNITTIFTQRKLDDDTIQELEDVLIQADLGIETAMAITDSLSANRYGKDISEEEIRTVLADEVEKVLSPIALPLELELNHKPHVILVVGVNGTGKTTTIGKLTAKLTREGASVMLAAGDTFRAAAVEQLKIWGERTGAPVIARDIGADAAGLAFDAIKEAKAAGSDVLMIDTAGRLQNRVELMEELEKVIRVIKKQDETAPHTVLLTLDATTGQNALQQVEIFKEKAGVNGLVMTKLDGTARGGILVAISAKHKLPVYFIGIGEGIDDLEPFEADEFAKAIAGLA